MGGKKKIINMTKSDDENQKIHKGKMALKLI